MTAPTQARRPGRAEWSQLTLAGSYNLTIDSAEQVAAEFDALADAFYEEVGPDTENQKQNQELAGAIRGPDNASVYTTYLGFVERFFGAELDAESPSRRGPGRIADAEPGGIRARASGRLRNRRSLVRIQ